MVRGPKGNHLQLRSIQQGLIQHRLDARRFCRHRGSSIKQGKWKSVPSYNYKCSKETINEIRAPFQFLVGAQAWVVGQVPNGGRARDNPSMFLFLPSPLKINLKKFF